MTRLLRVCVAAVMCAVAVGACSVAVASADSIPDDQSQLLDVSKQVGGIETKLNQLISRGQTIRSGKLFALAACGYGDFSSQVFLPWGDPAGYALAPQGDFSVSDQWTLSKQASVVDGGDPFSGAGRSLELGHDGQAGTPAMCVDLDNPTIRFFTRDEGGNGKSNLKVDVLYEDFNGSVKRLTVARLKTGADWQPSIVVAMYMNMLAAASPSGVTAVAFQFKAEGLAKGETLSISSLYVDPYSSK